MQINIALCVSESNLLSLIGIFFNKSEKMLDEDAAVTSARGFTSLAEEDF